MNDSTFLSLPIDSWRFINTFAPWFSALGTLAAVVVSLWLTLSRNRPKVRVSAGHRLIVTSGHQGPIPEIVAIRAVNAGDRMVRITGIGWQVGFWRWKRFGVQSIDDMTGGSRLPIEIEHGQEANWRVPFDLRDGWPIQLTRDFLLPHYRWNLFTMRVWVSTSVGRTFRAHVEGSLRKLLQAECEKQTQAGKVKA